MTFRRSEWISTATLLTLAGWIAWASAKKTVWDETAIKVDVISPRVELHDKELAVINTKLDIIMAGLGLEYRKK